MRFKIGDTAVYPAHGVGTIQSIDTITVGEERVSFYVMRILDTGVTIKIPTKSADQVGLRRIIDADQVANVYTILQQRNVEIEPKPWNRRYRQYMEKLKSGSPFEIAEVLRNLLVLKGEKVLSFGERKMLDTARALLIKEISLAKDSSVESVEADLKRLLNLQ